MSHDHHGHDHHHEPVEPRTPVQCTVQQDGSKLQLNVPVVLPEGAECDACEIRLIDALTARRGVLDAHVTGHGSTATLCIHYDSNLLTLDALERQVKESGGELQGKFEHVAWDIHGMDCGDCSRTIEHVVGRMEGVHSVVVNFAAEKMRVEFDSGATSKKAIQKKVKWLGYEVHSHHDHHEHDHDGHDHGDHDHSHGAGLKIALLSGIALLTGFLLETLTETSFLWILPIYLVAYVAGGLDATKHGFKAALRLRFDIEFLMVVAAIGAAILGEWAEGALLLFLFSLGHALEHMAMDKARDAMNALGEITPKTAIVNRNGTETEIPIEAVKIGDEVIVRAGDRMPVDGVVSKGQSNLDQSAITGESIPVEATVGSKVFAGSVNGNGSLRVEVTKLSTDSTISRVVKLVEEAQTQKSKSQRFTESFSQYFVPASLIFVGLVIAVPAILNFAPNAPFLGKLALPINDSFLRGMTILVAASPCALAISTPAAILSGIAQAARTGVLVKGGAHLENLGVVETVAFDKTGTLTIGRPEVTDVHGDDEKLLLEIAASAESQSNHPLAKAVISYAKNAGIAYQEPENLVTVPGKGIETTLEGESVRIGNQSMFKELPSQIKATVDRFENEGKTTIIVQKGDTILGVIAVADQIRPEAADVIAKLRKAGVKNLVMLTGDNETVARAVAEKIGITDIRASLLPEDKVAAIREFMARGPVAMVGDGINDAPAMANATVGIAMAAHGTDVAMETADIALMADSLEKLPFALGISKGTRRIIQQNLAVSLGTIALLIPFALFGLAGIGVAIIFHEGSTLLVVGNALRLLRYGGNQ